MIFIGNTVVVLIDYRLLFKVKSLLNSFYAKNNKNKE